MITLQNISKSFFHKHNVYPALTDISLTIANNTIHGIIGKSGAGKSTLLRCINLLITPDRGRVLINHTELTSLSPTALQQQRQQLGMIFQHFNLLNRRTVCGNIALPLELAHKPKHYITERVDELLELVELSDIKHHYPHQLSGGQQQRVAIARALALKPDFLLCDEATSALDAETTVSILDLLKRIQTKLGVTIVLVTHELDIIHYTCHTVSIMHDGKLIENGKVPAVLQQPQHPASQRLIAAYHSNRQQRQGVAHA